MKIPLSAHLLHLYSLASVVIAQQEAMYEQEGNPTITLKECTLADGCDARAAKLTLDANWRWIHSTTGSANCYTGNSWSSQFCSDPVECAQNCVLEGVPLQDYRDTYGIEQIQDGVKMKFVSSHQYGTNVGSRVYVMDEGVNDDKYKLFYLKNREFSFDVELSELSCGMNGAMYFTEMDNEGGKGLGDNNAGAKYGTGYCDAQCPHDIKFIDGEANVIDWIPNPNDQSNNMGIGRYGSCCAEMDIWEANSMATAYTPHTCDVPGQFRCDGIECGDNDAGERYDGVCDKDGCDINPYRMGNPNFYGRGPEFVVDTMRPMKVVTQFLTTDGTDNGDLSEIRRFYIQDGNIIESPFSTILAGNDADSITEDFCEAKKDLFGDVKHYQELGGMVGMGESLDRGQVMIFSLWDDVEVNMLWLDSAYPLDKPVSDPGVKRGECVGGIESTPTYLRENFPDAYVIFKNAAVGEIGSTYGNPIPTTQPPTVPVTPTEAPVEPPSSVLGYCNYNGCNGVVQGGDWCNESVENCEGNCVGTWCTNDNPSTFSPTEAPSPDHSILPSPPTGGMLATTTRYWDCSGGACGCAYLPFGDPWNPSHCYSNAMFDAPTNNVYGAKFYGTAAVSDILFEDDEGDSWLGDGCGKCFKVTGTSNTPGYSDVETTLVLKAANYCPQENPMCSGDNAHFDIAAPGFDVTPFSFAHVCPELEPAEAEGFAACGTWMIDDQNPDVNCDCSKFFNPVLRAGCENFYSLQWNNVDVIYERVDCPFELDRLECDEEYPFGVPEFCASNLDPTGTSFPSAGPSDFGSNAPSSHPSIEVSDEPSQYPTAQPSIETESPSFVSTTQPTECEDDLTDEFFFKMKNGEPLFKTCEWLSTRTDSKQDKVCKKTEFYDEIPPANQVCRVLCGTCKTSVPSISPSLQPSVTPTSSNPTELPTTSSSPSEYPSIEASTSPSTSSPTKAPTTITPTKSPINDPTMPPTTQSSDPCCSNDYQSCNLSTSSWCNESLANCQQCGGIFITGAPLQCIPKWGECTNDINGCCAPASCQGNSGYKQCLG